MNSLEAKTFLGGRENKMISIFGNLEGQFEKYSFLNFVEHLLKAELELVKRWEWDFLAGRAVRRMLTVTNQLDGADLLCSSFRESLKELDLDPGPCVHCKKNQSY